MFYRVRTNSRDSEVTYGGDDLDDWEDWAQEI